MRAPRPPRRPADMQRSAWNASWTRGRMVAWFVTRPGREVKRFVKGRRGSTRSLPSAGRRTSRDKRALLSFLEGDRGNGRGSTDLAPCVAGPAERDGDDVRPLAHV